MNVNRVYLLLIDCLRVTIVIQVCFDISRYRVLIVSLWLSLFNQLINRIPYLLIVSLICYR